MPSPARALSKTDLALGALMTLAALAHAGAHVAAGRWYDVFWICNLTALLIGPAVLLRSATLAAVGLTWMLPGTAAWLVDAFVSSGSHILPTSYGVHLGGSLVAVYAVQRNGYAPQGWLAALALLVVAFLVSRLLLPAHANVNVSHAIRDGWTFFHGSYPAFLAMAALLALALSAAGDRLGLALGRRRPGH